MANVSKLKEKARLLEQREQWKDALQTYEEIIEQSDGDDIGLWNRIGDLHMRMGQVEQAVDAYESAVAAYAEAGLHNNAIALCNKILRAVPSSTPTYLKLGQISAAQGFLADARANFLQYAERSRKAGQLDASFQALREFADLSPDDVEIRRMLADQLQSHGRTEQAVEQFRLLLGQLESRGRSAEADEVREQIRRIDPDANLSALGGGAQPRKQTGNRAGLIEDEDELHLLPSLERAPSAPSSDGELLDLHIDTDASSSGAEADAPAVLEGLQPTSEEDAFNITLPADQESSLLDIQLDTVEHGTTNDGLLRPDEADTEPNAISIGDGSLLEELTSSAVAESDADDAALPGLLADDSLRLDGFESTMQDSAWDDADEGDLLPVLNLDADHDDPADDDRRSSGSLFLPEGEEDEEEADSEPLPFLSMSDEWTDADASGTTVETDTVATDFPGYGYEDAEADEALTSHGASIEELRARHAADPDDGAVRDKLVLLLREQGLSEQAESVLETAHRSFATAERFTDAVDAIRGLIDLRSDDTALYQKQVEYAFRSGDRARLIQAYLDLGRHLESGENAAKSVAVYQRVLDLDPGNVEARRALAPATPEAGQSRSQMGRGGPPADEGYVDLAALIFDEDPREASTRFVVDEEEPTGDEDRDFADMLSRFRQKVAENIGVEDSTSHYDLGLAFKDMGLLDEAISQFQVALRGGADPLATLEVLGECFVEKRQFTLASRVLDRALRLPDVDESSLIGVYYWLGRCDETLGRTQTAQDFFERVLSLDIRFRDAANRLEALRATGQ